MGSDELLEDFIIEIQDLKAKMSITISKLIECKLQDKSLFEKFGQNVDRIYGTAMTLGHIEIGEYTKAMKDVFAGNDVEARRLLLMERAQPHMTVPLSF